MLNQIDWEHHPAGIWRHNLKAIKPVPWSRIHNVEMDELLHIDKQKQQICLNTEQFIKSQPAHHVLLWGSRGTGKSSLIKAVLTRYHREGLRLLQIDKMDLGLLPEICDELEQLPYFFLVYCDDLSFSDQDDSYKPLKTVLDGTIETPPKNVLLYASSNRRHLIPEKMQDNDQVHVAAYGEIHYTDSTEEILSLADRFGLKLAFFPFNQQAYLDIVFTLFSNKDIDAPTLVQDALLFARTRGNFNGRTAQFFFSSYTKNG